MPIMRKVISSVGIALPCCWDDCENPGYELHKIRVFHGGQLEQYVFCSERHKAYFANGHLAYGKLPPGFQPVL